MLKTYIFKHTDWNGITIIISAHSYDEAIKILTQELQNPKDYQPTQEL